MGTNCAPLRDDIFRCWYEAEFIQFLLSTGKKHFEPPFNPTYRYIDVVLCKQPRIRKLSWQDISCWTWDQWHNREHHFCFLPRFIVLIWRDGQLHNSIFDKRDDSNFHITIFPFLGSNIPSSPAFLVFIFQLWDAPGLAPRMTVLLRGLSDFPASYSNKYAPWNAWSRHSESFMIETVRTLFSVRITTWNE